MSARDDLEAEIRAQVMAAAEVRDYLGKVAEQVRDYWRSVAPVDEGRYAASIQVFKKNYTVDGMPAKKVGATDFKSVWIEYGTGEPGPTKPHAPRAKTAAHFGGNEARVDMVLANTDLSFDQRKALLSQFNSVEVGDE